MDKINKQEEKSPTVDTRIKDSLIHTFRNPYTKLEVVIYT